MKICVLLFHIDIRPDMYWTELCVKSWSTEVCSWVRNNDCRAWY